MIRDQITDDCAEDDDDAIPGDMESAEARRRADPMETIVTNLYLLYIADVYSIASWLLIGFDIKTAYAFTIEIHIETPTVICTCIYVTESKIKCLILPV